MLARRIIFQGFGFWRWAGSLGGALLGWWLLFGGWQAWRLAEHSLLPKADQSAPDFFIIQKAVPVVNLFGAAGISFSEAEIAALTNLPGVKAVAPFEGNRFQAHADFGSESALAALETDLFFEALPDDFLDGKLERWQWQPGDAELPIVISRDYVALYNFGFAQSRHLPRLSETLLRQLRFSVRISGRGKALEFKGRIAGFSQRINSILVPTTFMRWANQEYGEGQARPARLIIQADASAAPALGRHFQSQNYEYDSGQLRSARIRSALGLFFTAAIGFGVAVLALACWVFALSFQLMIVHHQENLRKLVWLGFSPAAIARWYLFVIAGAVGFLVVAGAGFLGFGTRWLTTWVGQQGYPVTPLSIGPPLAGMVMLGALLAILNYGLLRRQLFRLA